MKKHLLFLPCFFLLNRLIFSQTAYNIAGARGNAMGDATVASADVFSTINNQAGLAFLERSAIGISAQNYFSIQSLNTITGAVAIKTKGGTFGASVINYGNADFHQIKIGLAYGVKLTSKLGAGIQLDYVGTNITEYGSGSAFTFEAGLRYSIYKDLIAAAKIFNPVQAKLGNNFSDETLPAIFNLGLSYLPGENVIIAIEGEENLDYDISVKTGIEYHVAGFLFLRGGYKSNPSQFTAGAGLQIKELKIDIAAQFHQQLGMSPSVSIAYNL